MSLTALEWDSRWFGLRIAAADPAAPAEAAARADAEGVDCTYLLLPADDEQGLRDAQSAGFAVVDVRVELDKAVAAAVSGGPQARAMRQADVPALEALCRERFAGTRFAADPRFPRDRVRELYVAWLDRARTTSDREVLVLPGVAGFVICHVAGGTGAIELISTREAGRGGGTALCAAADAHFAAAGATRATVVTQARNLAALRLYARCGYRPWASAYWLHRWRVSP